MVVFVYFIKDVTARSKKKESSAKVCMIFKNWMIDKRRKSLIKKSLATKIKK